MGKNSVKAYSMRNYGGKVRFGGRQVRCYTRRQIKEMFPENDYAVTGICLPDRAGSDERALLLGGGEYNLYDPEEVVSIFKAVVGYVRYDDDDRHLIALMKNIFALWIVAGVMLIALNAAAVFLC